MLLVFAKKSSITRHAARSFSAHNGPFSTSQDCGPRVSIGRYEASLIGTTPRITRHYDFSRLWVIRIGLGRVFLPLVRASSTDLLFLLWVENDGFFCDWRLHILVGRDPRGPKSLLYAIHMPRLATAMLTGVNLRSLSVLVPTGQMPCAFA